MFRLIGVLLLLFGFLIWGTVVWRERTPLRLLFGGEPAEGRITAVNGAGKVALPRDRNQALSSAPRDVSAFLLEYAFQGPEGEVEGATRLTFYEVAALFPDFDLIQPEQPVGQTAPVRYLSSDPAVSQIAHPLSWAEFWSWLLGGLAFVALGAVWTFGRRPQPPLSSPHPK